MKKRKTIETFVKCSICGEVRNIFRIKPETKKHFCVQCKKAVVSILVKK